MLLAARHVHDLGRGKSDLSAEVEQKAGIVGDCGFGLLFGLDMSVTEVMAECVSLAIARRQMLHIEVGMHHCAACSQ